MWIFLGILVLVALIITAILMLPVYVIIKNDENGELIIRYKILHKIFGENPDPNNPILKTLKKASGISRLEKKNIKSSTKTSGVSATVSQTLRIVIDLLKEIVTLLKYCTLKRFFVDILCAEEDAAETALSYGQCCATVYPLAGFLSSMMRTRKKSFSIHIGHDYEGGQEKFDFDVLISVKLCRVVAAFFRIAFKEAKRTVDKQTALQSSSPKNKS